MANNDILGFGQPDEPDMFQLLAEMEAIASVSGDLSNGLIDSLARELETIAKTINALDQKIMKPIVEDTMSAAQISDSLNGRLKQALEFELGQANELTQQLDSRLPRVQITGDQPLPPIAQDIYIPEIEVISPGGPLPLPGEGNGTGGTGGVAPDDIATAVGANGDDTISGGPGGTGGGQPTGGGGGGGPSVIPIVCPDGSIVTPPDTCSIGPPPPPPLPQPCPPGTHWDTTLQRCVADFPQQQGTGCPAPVVQCPQPPDINVEVNPVISPPMPLNPSQDPSIPSPPDREFVPTNWPERCETDAYDPARLQPPGADIRFNAPFTALLYGDGAANLAMQTEALQNAGGNWTNPFRSLFWFGRYLMLRTADRADAVWRWTFATEAMENDVATIGVLISQWIIYLGGIVFGPAFGKRQEVLQYAHNALQPTQFPDHEEAIEAYARGTIDNNILKIWLAQNNQCFEPWARLIKARTDRVEPLMALQMWKRRFLSDEQFEEQIRKAGIIDKSLADAFRDLGDFVPPITDLVRFMVRDVEDEEIEERFGLSSEFEDKWRGRSKEWGEMQGITDDAAQSYWKAHWRLPSPTQLYDMFHRTRHLPDDDPLKTTISDVETALKQDDMLPFWVPKLINSTFRLLSRIDARRAFETGAIDEANLRILFTKLGYEESAIDALLRWSKINKTNVILNRPEVKLFRDGLYDEVKLRAVLAETKLTEPEMAHIIELATLQQRKQFMSRCVSAIRDRFLTGELDRIGTMVALHDFGLSSTATDTAVSAFECEKAAQGKQPPTSMLCQWLDQGSITPQQMIDRLVNIGWTRDDAFRILGTCTRQINQRLAKEAERLAKEQQRAEEKAAREQQAEQRRREAAAKNAKRQLEKAERLKANRDKLMQRTIAKFSESAPLDLDTATACVLSLERQLAADTLLGIDERIQTIVMTVERIKPKSCAELKSTAQDLANALLEFGQITDEWLAANFPGAISVDVDTTG